MKTSQRGLSLIKEFEGFRSKAYRDVAKPDLWSIGYGFVDGVKAGDSITKEAADERLMYELVKYERGVLNACVVPPNQNQFDALVCFAWNVGISGMRGSSVIKAHNRGDFQSAARAFGLWNKAGGKVWPGLTRRRAAESALYLEPIVDFTADEDNGPAQDMPQVVEPERPMRTSNILRASTVAGGTAALATVAETVQTVNTIKWGVDSLGAWLVPLLMLTVLVLVGYIAWERLRQRREGWA